MDKIKDKPLLYLCTVYTSHAWGLDEAALEASSLLGKLLKAGHRVFCPIAHCHRASMLEGLPTDFDWWMDYDEGWIDLCDGLLVAKMDNWEQSKGIRHEVRYANAVGKPVQYLDVDTMEIQ